MVTVHPLGITEMKMSSIHRFAINKRACMALESDCLTLSLRHEGFRKTGTLIFARAVLQLIFTHSCNLV